MSTAEFLLQVRELERTIWRLTLRRDELQSRLLPGAVRYDLDRVQTSPEDRFGAVAAAVADLDRKLQDLRVRKADLVIEVSEAIDELTDDREKTILTAYYVGRLPMTEIADRIGYSLQHTYRLRKAGVSHLAKDEKHEKPICATM